MNALNESVFSVVLLTEYYDSRGSVDGTCERSFVVAKSGANWLQWNTSGGSGINL
jgi:hypothetical protein